MNRYTQLAASLAVLVAIVTLLFPPIGGQRLSAAFDDFILAPEGGQLNAFDEEGQLIGPCPLKHTDVDVQISGHFTRVSVTQRYHNPYDDKIEAVYTFPLSHRAAVDRMTMTIGDRIVVGEVKEREAARQIYEAARAQGYVASLLEQERPNIFTQSVANIEPGAEVVIEISYVEVLQSVDGRYHFDFPMVVAPRYTPGRPTGMMEDAIELPEGALPRPGVVLLGPAEIRCGTGNCEGLTAQFVHRHFVPLDRNAQIINLAQRQREDPMTTFRVRYADGQTEPAVMFSDGVGHVGGRWFICPPRVLPKPGHPFSAPTDQVPDADRVTPMPVKPDQRAGHDISVTVTINTGGPGITEIKSLDHEITSDALLGEAGESASKATITLATGRDIPNRDFRLNWKTTSDRIEEAIFTHTGDYGDYKGGFFTLILQPPDRIADEDVRSRELIFVLDQSGSMSGARLADRSALDAAKDVISKAIETMRPSDRFNIVSFNNSLDVLWEDSQPNTAENRAIAQRYIDRRQGGGGTEMRNAVLRALGAGPFAPRHQPQRERHLSPMDLANLPADGRQVAVLAPLTAVEVGERNQYFLRAAQDVAIELGLRTELPTVLQPEGVDLLMKGRWVTLRGQRIFVVEEIETLFDGDEFEQQPMRIVLFVTDGLVSNDAAIIQAIREHAHETRVFTIGMSHSPNRHLLDEMARVGRGAVDYVLPNDDVMPIVERFAQRIATPVLTDIELIFSDGLKVTDVLPSPEHMPDLFDVQPLVIHGRYTEPGAGKLTIRGRTGAGRYERVLDLEFPELAPQHDTIATLWAREKVGELMREIGPGADIRPIIALGESFQIMTQYTSFVAVEKRRVTIGGEPVLVRVPIEFPKGMSWEGIFGPGVTESEIDDVVVERFLSDVIRQQDPGGVARDRAIEERRSVRARAAPPMSIVPDQDARRMSPPAPGHDAVPRVASPLQIEQPASAGRRPTRPSSPEPVGTGGLDMDGLHIVESRRVDLNGALLGDIPILDNMFDAEYSVQTMTLRHVDADELTEKLQQLLGGRSDADGKVELGSVGHAVRIKDSDRLFLAVLSPLRDTIEPFAEKLADEKLSDDERSAILAELTAALREQVPQVQRDLELRRVLDERLYAMLSGVHDEDAKTKADDSLVVTILLADVETDTLDALRDLGVRIIDVAAPHSFIIAEIAPGSLEALTLHRAVRRVELVK